ncbi:MAG: PSD1 and planctomycete cytochrome C domain-containing protein [Flavobacteriaceae bacterium]
MRRTISSIQMRYGLLASLVCILLSVACKEQSKGPLSMTTTPQDVVPNVIDFTFHVKPILSDRCFKCHGPDKNAVEGGLSLHTAESAYEALGEQQDHHAIVPGNPDKSELIHRINSTDPGLLMPPPESNLTLTEWEKTILKKWIEQGAEYKQHWAFTAPTEPKVPSPPTQWGHNEIDAFVWDKIDAKGLRPSERASKEKLVRRIFFDLTGLPPTVAQVQSFVENKDPKAFEHIVDSLLGTPDYAEHMALEWMDIARYADTHGYQDDFERIMWPWRDWVIHAFQKNMPYDQFVIYQLAGDLLPNPTREQIIATGFNRNHKITFEGGVIPEEYRVEYVEDRTNTFGTAFMGLTLECARCHDHKYDPVSQKEHFQLFGFFNNIDEKGLVSNQNETPKPYITLSAEKEGQLLEFIHFNQSERQEIPLMVMEEMTPPRATHILDRGLYDHPTEQVFPGTPEAILPFPKELPQNRLGLAQWLFHKDNPLTARVTVNRLWQRMFGTGLVATSFDFGNQGALPTHPELLDFLALKLRDEGWDLQKMLKYMALSATYQQSTKTTPKQLEIDPENQWLARASRLRLPAETIRDQALKVSGLLTKEVGGPSVKPYQPEGLWEETTGGGGGSTAAYIMGQGKDLYRKSLYTFWKRTVPPPNMLTFDAASRDLCTVKRQETNTPLQALVLLNDPQLLEASRVMAQHLLGQGNTSTQDHIQRAFAMVTSRLPAPEEANTLFSYYEDVIKKIGDKTIDPEEYLAIGQSPVPGHLSKTELTALALTVHTIMNLDESITRG